MKDKERTIQQNDKKKPIPYTAKCVIIGFWGGLIWSFVGYLAALLNFTAYGPALVLSPLGGDWKNGAIGQIIGIFVMALLSILTALIYKLILARWYSMWIGVAYGAVLWFIVFWILNPFFPKLKPLLDLDRNTLVTTFCLYLLYGLFIGYSICFEYHELNEPEDQKSQELNSQQVGDSES